MGNVFYLLTVCSLSRPGASRTGASGPERTLRAGASVCRKACARSAQCAARVLVLRSARPACSHCAADRVWPLRAMGLQPRAAIVSKLVAPQNWLRPGPFASTSQTDGQTDRQWDAHKEERRQQEIIMRKVSAFLRD